MNQEAAHATENVSSEILLEKFTSASRIVPIMDSRFDLDSLCAQLVMKEYFQILGKQYEIYFEQAIPEKAYSLIPKARG